jgi:hypothetical protein
MHALYASLYATSYVHGYNRFDLVQKAAAEDPRAFAGEFQATGRNTGLQFDSVW